MPTLSHSSRILVVASSYLLLLAVVSADVILGRDFGVLLFYLVPIAWCALFAGRLPALFVAVCCASARYGVELVQELNDQSRPAFVWSIASELLFFLIFTSMLLKMHQLFEEERALARTDQLTRLLNARAFHEAVAGERERLNRYGRTLTLVYFDLDNFKSVNDRLGHHTGDALLRVVADTIRENTRQVDQSSRLGGDEFALLLPETDEHGAHVVLDRLRSKLREAMEQRGWPVTCSMGSCTFHHDPPAAHRMLQAADEVMYKAKHSGKNQLILETWEAPEDDHSARPTVQA